MTEAYRPAKPFDNIGVNLAREVRQLHFGTQDLNKSRLHSLINLAPRLVTVVVPQCRSAAVPQCRSAAG
jgi:hypothetical protein